jgi:dihydroorotase
LAFKPLMTCYLTDETDADQVAFGFATGVFAAAKLYPAHATTNSAHGVTDITAIRSVLARMEGIGMPLLVHGEVTDPEVDVFDREAAFIERILEPLLRDFSGLKVVLEHITTSDAVDFVIERAEKRLAATITAHHLMINRNAIFQGGLRPHMYCLPIAKRERHRLALRRAATSGNLAFFLGSDTAPHSIGDKESDCGCAGIFTAPAAIELYAQIFAEEGALDKLEGFASRHGPAFYGLPVNDGMLKLKREDWTVPEYVILEDGGCIKPFLSGETLQWQMMS